MNKSTKKGFLQKIVITILTIILLEFSIPIKSEAITLLDWELPTAEDIISGAAQIVAAAGDIVMSALNNFMLGTAGFTSAMVSQGSNEDSWFYEGEEDKVSGANINTDNDVDVEEQDGEIVTFIKSDYLDEDPVFGSDSWEIPNLLYCPENIFGNKIAMLDVNFLNPNTYVSVVESGRGKSSADEKSQSIALSLTETVSNWYKAFRNIAIVALLSILVYLGIRILISSTSEDKAKYKESIRDWAIALCLVFVMHFIMAATIMLVNQINSLFNNINSDIYIQVYNATDNGNAASARCFKTNFTGEIRFLAQAQDGAAAWAYTIMYWALIIYTVMFTFQYLKRVLYIAFYTMISPLVAITYPIDKLGDGRSQAFNMWFKEYIMTMLLQPIHLVLYTMIVSSALTLSINNPLFGLIALGFMIPAEQFIKQLFGVQPQADKGMGSFAGGALTMAGLNKLSHALGGKKPHGGKDGNGAGGSGTENKQNKIRTAHNPQLSSFNNSDSEGSEGSPESQNNSNPSTNGNSQEDIDFSSVPIPGSWGESTSGMNAGGDQGTDRQTDSNPYEVQGYSEPYSIYDGSSSDSNLNGANGEQAGGAQNNGAQAVDAGNNEPEISEEEKENQELQQLENERNRELNGNEAWDRFSHPITTLAVNHYDNQRRRQIKRKQFKRNMGKKWSNIKGSINKENFARVGKNALAGVANGARTAKRKLRAAPKALLKTGVKYTGKGLKKLGHAAVKTAANMPRYAAQVALGAAAGSIGVAAGIASGQGLSAVAKNATVGVAAGVAIGSRVPGSESIPKVQRGLSQVKTDYVEAQGGKEAADKYRYKNDPQVKQKYKDLTKRLNEDNNLKGSDKLSYKQVMDKAYDYEKYGISDDEKLRTAMQMEYNHKGFEKGADSNIHDNIVDTMRLTKTYDESYIHDEKKRQTFDNALNSYGATGTTKEDIKELFYEAHGQEYKRNDNTSYDERMGIQSGTQAQTPTPQTGNTQRTGTQQTGTPTPAPAQQTGTQNSRSRSGRNSQNNNATGNTNNNANNNVNNNNSGAGTNSEDNNSNNWYDLL